MTNLMQELQIGDCLRIVPVLLMIAVLMPMTGYTDTFENRRHAFLKPENRAVKFQNPHEYHAYRSVRRSERVLALKKADKQDLFMPLYTWKGKSYGADEFYERSLTNALLVLKNGKTVVERYRNDSNERTGFISFSMAKAVLSLLVGMASEDGHIKSLHNPLTHYLPGLSGSAYAEVSIENALQMLSGVDFDSPWDVVDPTVNPDIFFRARRDCVVRHRFRFVEVANTLRRNRPVSVKFCYNNMDSAVVGWLLETVVQKRLSTYMQERLWQPAGMESDAYWLLDGPVEIGREFAPGGLVATLRDYGRLGQLILNKGKMNGTQLISPAWIAASTTPNNQQVQFGHLIEGYPFGYGYYWWLLPGGEICAQGAFGQFIYIAPHSKVVIVLLSYWPKVWVDDMEMECYAFFNSVIEALDQSN